jgi:uncharacterized protein (DUF736 family)
MAIIGTFTQDQDGSYSGTISTLTINVKAKLTPIETRSESAPDFRVTAGKNEVGAGWKKDAKSGGEYISLKIDDPSFTAPIFASLVASNEGGYNLLWDRPKASK